MSNTDQVYNLKGVLFFTLNYSKSSNDTLMKRNHQIMIQKIYKATQILAFVPFMAIPSLSTASHMGSLEARPVTKEVRSVEQTRNDRAEAINSFFKERKMPMHGTGMTFVLVAEKYGLDWRLLPAISIRESSGGKQACGYNAFGWGSCKLGHNFNSYEEAIESLGRNLGGANKNTSKYYAGKSTEEKLYYYNGSVEPPYSGEVLAIMDMTADELE